MADNRQFTPGSGTDPNLRMKEISSDLLAPIVFAGEHVRSYDGIETISIGASVSTLTVPSGATHADVYLDTTAATMDSSSYVRYWHGTNPSSSVGVRLFHNEQFSTAQPSQLRVTNGSGTGATLRVNYYHYA